MFRLSDRRALRHALHVCVFVVARTAIAADAAVSSDEAQRAIEESLRLDREAHLQLDAASLVSRLADTLVTVDGGRIDRSARAELQAFFEGYFRGATYHAWEDVEPPVIRVSQDGTMAWATRRVRVDREEPAPAGTRRREFTSAWTATYARTDAGWRMTSVTSTVAPALTATTRIVAGARRAAGWTEATLPPALSAEADVAGPRDSFRVRVLSGDAEKGRVDWLPGPSLVRTAAGAGWVVSPGAAVEDLSPDTETMLVGHETHWNALRPDRLGPLTYTGRARFAGQEALRLTVLNPVGAPIDLYYAAADTLPLGFRTGDHLREERGPIEVRFGDWRAAGAGRLFYSVTFTQDDEVFRYAFQRIEGLDALEAGELARPQAAP